MSSDGEEVPHDIVDGQEALDLRSRSEASQVAFATPCRLVGDFGPIVGVAGGVMHNRRHDDPVRGAVAPKAIGDEAALDAPTKAHF
jgi:hypothetical protein